MGEPRITLRSHSRNRVEKQENVTQEGKQKQKQKQKQQQEVEVEVEVEVEQKQKQQVEVEQKQKMEKLLSYFKESCNLDPNLCTQAAETVINATNCHQGILQLSALMLIVYPQMTKAEAYRMAKEALDTHYQTRKPSFSGSVTLSMSLPSEALDLVKFHTSHDESHTSRDISGQFSSIISEGSSHSPAIYQDWGNLALESPVDDDSFPNPACANETRKLWPEKQWNTVLSQKTVLNNGTGVIISAETKLKNLIDMQKRRGMPRYVNFVFAKATGKLCAEKRPDFYLTRKVAIETPTPEAVGAILFTQSTTQSSNRYDSAVAVGEAIAVGQKFLANTSKQRSFVIVGVTNLKAVRWFKVCKSGRYLRCSETAHVASSLAGYMYSSPENLGLTSCMVKVEKISYPLGRFLGEGHTSNVHVVTVKKEAFAVKVPKTGNELSSDILYLKKLCGIKGIPIINHVYSTSTAVFTKPVCLRFTADVLFEGNLQRHLAQLVDTLECAHERMVVNRDVRMENIMVADSQFVIVDWGYAATLNDPVSYAGTTYFASARVLKLLEEGAKVFATNASDDLVSLVQSLSLLVRRSQEWQKKLYALSKMDYAGIRSFWEKYFAVSSSDLLTLALNTSYSELRNGIVSWALSL